jgi:hypothetical protein
LNWSVQRQVEVDKEAKRRAVEWIRSNPGQFIGLLPMKFFRLWAPDGESEWWYQAGFGGYSDHAALFRAIRGANQLYYVGTLLVFAWGCWQLRPRRRRDSRIDMMAFFLPVAVCLFPTAICLVFSGQSRFHFPSMPFIFMVLGWSLWQMAGGRAEMRAEIGH